MDSTFLIAKAALRSGGCAFIAHEGTVAEQISAMLQRDWGLTSSGARWIRECKEGLYLQALKEGRNVGKRGWEWKGRREASVASD